MDANSPGSISSFIESELSTRELDELEYGLANANYSKLDRDTCKTLLYRLCFLLLIRFDSKMMDPVDAAKYINEKYKDLVSGAGFPHSIGASRIKSEAFRIANEELFANKRDLTEQVHKRMLIDLVAAQNTVSEKIRAGNVKAITQLTQLSNALADMLPGYAAQKEIGLELRAKPISPAQREQIGVVIQEVDEYENDLLGGEEDDDTPPE